jgi:hypothetical protein
MCVEEAFRAKVAIFATDPPEMLQETERPQPQRQSNRGKKARRSNVIDKSVLALPETRRVRDREHVRYVTQQSCLICGRRPADAHHLRFAQSPALGRRVSDERRRTRVVAEGSSVAEHRSGRREITKHGGNRTSR